MLRVCFYILVVVAVIAMSATARCEEPAVPNDKLILAHYMPWFESKDVSGKWGWHWTMNQFDPDKTGKDDLPEIAAHFHPLIGLYDSNDPHALECHLQQMKLAGIDGVIIDWYGTKDANDYAMLHRNTCLLYTSPSPRDQRGSRMPSSA